LLRRLNQDEKGLFLDGTDKHLYVVQKQGQGLVPIRQMDVTIAKNGFSNTSDSGGSPYGEMWISSIMEGRIGEVLLHENTSTYSTGDLVNNVNGRPTIVTGRLSLSDYRADHRLAQRGVAFHGTNAGFNSRGQLELNEDASGGCYRLASGDVTDLILKHVKRSINEEAHNGTPVFVAKTRQQPAQKPPVNAPTAETNLPEIVNNNEVNLPLIDDVIGSNSGTLPPV
jgi:hypothetical protein